MRRSSGAESASEELNITARRLLHTAGRSLRSSSWRRRAMSAMPWIEHGHGVDGRPVPPFVQTTQRPARSGTCWASRRFHTSTIGASSMASWCRSPRCGGRISRTSATADRPVQPSVRVG